MPIKGLTERRQLPRLGKIHLGVKLTNAKGVEYPSAVDYFVCPPEVKAVYGEKPKELTVMFPPAEQDTFASQFYRSYSRSRGLVCKGDGDRADRTVYSKDAARMKETGEVPPIAGREDGQTERVEIPCPGRECPYFRSGDCKGVMNLQVMLPDVPGIGIYQIDTASVNSIVRVNSVLDWMQRLFGRVSGVPITLALVPMETQGPDGKKKNIFVLDPRLPAVKLAELTEVVRTQREQPLVALPEPDGEIPEDLYPTKEQAKARDDARATPPVKAEVVRPTPPAPLGAGTATAPPPQARRTGQSASDEFWPKVRAAHPELDSAQVLTLLDIKTFPEWKGTVQQALDRVEERLRAKAPAKQGG